MESHGADIYTASRISGIEEDSIIDFSSNINPLGVPESVEVAAMNSIKNANRYPDINSRKLTEAIAVSENVPEEWIFVSNGAAEAIFRIAFYLKPERGLVTAPTFSEYESAMKSSGTIVNAYNLFEENNFKIEDDIFKKIDKETDIVFLCNPNNPTGQVTDSTTVEKIAAHCKKNNAVMVVDECFLDFVEIKKKYSVVDKIKKYDNLIVLKAFTKIYAIPGIRLGYCMSSNKELIQGLKSSGPPWNVSTIAQAAGTASLKEKEYVKKSVEYVSMQREYLVKELEKLNIKTYESHANYVFFKTNIPHLKEEMLKKGILIRDCSNYKNLSDEYYRVAVKKEHENKILIEKLKEITGIQ
jgi:L-threonine-O-3-phosphate decarboxylase